MATINKKLKQKQNHGKTASKYIRLGCIHLDGIEWKIEMKFYGEGRNYEIIVTKYE